MNCADAKRASMESYPSLFLHEFDWLNHVFFCCGNGLRWKDGALYDVVTGIEDVDAYIRDARDSSRAQAIESIAYEKERWETDKKNPQIVALYSTRRPWDFWQKELDDLDTKSTEEMRQKELHRRRWYLNDPHLTDKASDCWFITPDGSVGNVITVAGNHHRIHDVPDDIQPDWLAAMWLAIDITKTDRVRFRTFGDKANLDAAEAKLLKRFPRD